MLFVSYDFASDSTRAKFHKFLKKFGRSIQYSVFEIDNSPRILRKILNEIEHTFKKKFTLSDSILIWSVSESEKSKIYRYGWSVNEESDFVEME